MLDRTTTHSPAPIAPQVIGGQTIAKAKWNPRERAFMAAKWKLGTVRIEPTVTLAASVFGVSSALVTEAVRDLRARPTRDAAPATSVLESAWAGLADADREDFARAHLVEIWSTIERITA